VRRLLLLVLLLGLASAPALAGPYDPQRQFTAADTARARSVALRAADLPGRGWRGSPSAPGGGQFTCAGFRPDQSDLVQTGRAESRDFERADGLFASSVTGIFRTAAMAASSFDRVAAPGLLRCLTTVFSEAISQTPGATVTDPSALRSNVPRVAPRTRAYRLGLTIQADGRSVPARIDVVLLGSGRVNTAVLAIGIGKPFPPQALVALSRRVSARMATA
jgi:hypothetical protein